MNFQRRVQQQLSEQLAEQANEAKTTDHVQVVKNFIPPCVTDSRGVRRYQVLVIRLRRSDSVKLALVLDVFRGMTKKGDKRFGSRRVYTKSLQSPNSCSSVNFPMFNGQLRDIVLKHAKKVTAVAAMLSMLYQRYQRISEVVLLHGLCRFMLQLELDRYASMPCPVTRITSIVMPAELVTRLHVLLLAPPAVKAKNPFEVWGTPSGMAVIVDPADREGLILGEICNDKLGFQGSSHMLKISFSKQTLQLGGVGLSSLVGPFLFCALLPASVVTA